MSDRNFPAASSSKGESLTVQESPRQQANHQRLRQITHNKQYGQLTRLYHPHRTFHHTHLHHSKLTQHQHPCFAQAISRLQGNLVLQHVHLLKHRTQKSFHNPRPPLRLL